MDAFLKSGAFFVTITPSDVGTMMVSILAGQVTAANVRSMQRGDIPDSAERLRISGLDPVACAEYFELICEAFVREIVAFDVTRGLPFDEGGLFGYVKAFIGAIESQNNETLHMHCIIFSAGLPRTTAGFFERCTDPEYGERFKSKFSDMVDSIISTSVPCGEEDLDRSCL